MVGVSTPTVDLAATWLDHQRAEGITPNTVAAARRVMRSLPHPDTATREVKT